MSATTVPAVRTALVARLAALLGADAQVIYGHPGQTIPKTYVAVATTEAGVTREQRTMPLRRTSSRTETYDLRLVVWCATGDHSSAAQQAVIAKAWDLCDRIDDDLRAEPTLGGLVDWALPSKFDDDDFLLNEGRAAQVVVLISVHVNRA